MPLYVNNSRRKVKFKLNKLINAAAAAARAARSRQRTPACASRQGAPADEQLIVAAVRA